MASNTTRWIIAVAVAAALLIVPWRYVQDYGRYRQEIKAGYSLLFYAPATPNYNTEIDYPRYGLQLLATAVLAAMLMFNSRQRKE